MSKVPERIILVDGDENTRLSVKMFYEKRNEDNENAVMVTCSSGEELLLRLKIIAPDLVIIGQNLDGIDGLETIRAMREKPEGKDMPVIFLADRKNLEMRNMYQKIGLAGILYKPLNAIYLPDMIAQIWNSISHEPEPEKVGASGGQESLSPA